MEQHRSPPAHWLIPAVIAALASLAWLAGGSPESSLRYERGAILAGEIHRLLTGQFLHLGGLHLALNLAGLGLVWGLVGANLRWREWLLCCLVTMLSVGCGLLAFAPQVVWYVGLSGMLHGLLVAGALLGRRGDWLIVLLVALKLGWEQWRGAPAGEWLGGATIIEAHLYGAVGGALAALALRVARGTRSTVVRP
jgi:rhomboid family GlyGly-CTERM serine protease